MEFRILGPLEVVTEDGQRLLFGPRQARVLAALLLAAGQVVTIHDLIDAVWDDNPPATARRQIQNSVWALRKHLTVVMESTGYRIRVDGHRLDSDLFSELVAEARVESAQGRLERAVDRLATALRLWRGSALAGSTGRAIEAGATRLNELRLAAIEQRLDLELQLGRDRDLIGELTELVNDHPLRERFVGQLMVALHRSGRQADALGAYRRLRSRLVDELGLEPDAGLRALQAALLRDEVAGPPLPVPAPPPVPTATSFDQIAEDLADAVAAQWRAEAAIRALHQPAPIQVPWARISDGVSASRSAILATRAGPASDVVLPGSGVLDEIADAVLRLPNRQLVVLGPPGAGKSALAIVVALDLLARRTSADHVPVLLTLSSWDPSAEHLDAWVDRRLVEEYPALGAVTHGRTAAAALLDKGRLLLILDGLDEMPVESHPAALAAINNAIGHHRPLVVTCRDEEYRRAVAAGGVVLAHAMVVAIGPVDQASAIAYLAGAGPVDDSRWAPVFAHLRGHSDGPLAEALSTPLMVWLARTVYLPAAKDPTALLNVRRFATRRALEDHLLGALVPTVYAPRPPAPSAGSTGSAARPYPPRKAAAWLAALARHLHGLGTPDLAWWHLHAMVPRTLLAALAGGSVAAVGGLGCLLYAVVPALRPGLPLAVTAALTTIPALAVVVGLASPPPWPVHLAGLRSTRRRWSRLGTGTAAGALAGAVSAPVGGPRLGIGLMLIGTAGGVFINAVGRSDLLRARRPGEVHRDDRTTLAALVLGAAVVGAIGGLLFAGFAIDYPLWLLNALAGAFGFGAAGYILGRPRYRRRAKIGTEPETGPAALVGAGIGASLGGLFGAGIGLAANGLSGGLMVLAPGAIVGGIGLGWLAGLAITASGWFTLARLYLTGRSYLPWRLLDFLDDAQRRGVLRQIGGVWQFRHAQLQEHLATGRTGRR